MKGNLYVLVGLPGSGKSTYAKKYIEENKDVIIMSSDELRLEIHGSYNDQSNNNLIFEEMFRRTKKHLRDGKTVIYDATNINRKKRKHLLKQLNNSYSYAKCIFMYRNLEQCYFWNNIRDKSVDKQVIYRMYKNFEIPSVYEGFDDVEIIHDIEEEIFLKNEFLDKIDDLSLSDYQMLLSYIGCSNCIDYCQNSIYHSLSIDRHMYKSYLKAKEFNEENRKILLACLLHDCMKPMSMSIDKDGIHYHFYRHENMSAYSSIEMLARMGIKDSNELLHISNLIGRHMLPYTASKEKWETCDYEFNMNLFTLYNADVSSK